MIEVYEINIRGMDNVGRLSGHGKAPACMTIWRAWSPLTTPYARDDLVA